MIGCSGTTSDGRAVAVTIRDAVAFEAIRDALGDPVWLVGATWELLSTNEYKQGRFVDALGAWLSHQRRDDAAALLRGAGAEVTDT